ncbi:hypothetical protein GCM10020000_07430 [Streptomyces olivoverticillatus]
MVCRTTGDVVENNSRWIWSGAYYVADAFISEDTGSLPACNGARPTNWTALNIGMQKQVQNQWCWDASGLTIANYWGYTRYNQYDFCRLAAQNNQLDCNNQPSHPRRHGQRPLQHGLPQQRHRPLPQRLVQ